MRAAPLCAVAALCACDALHVELDHDFRAASPCTGDICQDGQSRCEPDSGVRQLCVSGCFVNEPCAPHALCAPSPGGALCVSEPTDCELVDVSSLIAVCGVNDALCALCGCYMCEHAGEAYCDVRGGEGVLTCTAPGCFAASACGGGDACVSAWFEPVAACQSEVDCYTMGCNGPPVCGLTRDCGPCGCCELGGGQYPDYCDLSLDGSREARWLYDETERCYTVLDCGPTQLCMQDRYHPPWCGSSQQVQ